MAINLFQIAQQDQSVSYLGQLFGFVGNLLPAQNPNLIVGPVLFKTLNTMALTIGAFLIVYVTVVGLLRTAQEGEFLGKQWNSLWVPIRTVLGIAALFPTPTGYSAIQIVIMWVILQGVGAADVLWTKVLQFINVNGGSLYAGVNSANLPLTAIQPEMNKLFKSLTCQASAKATYTDINTDLSGGGGASGDSIKYYCAQEKYRTTAFCSSTDADLFQVIPKDPQTTPGNTYTMGPSGACGVLTYCSLETYCKAKPVKDLMGNIRPPTQEEIKKAANSIGCLSCQAQRSVLQAIVPTFGAIANKVVAIDNQYAQFYERPVSPADAPDWIKGYCTANAIPPNECCKNPSSTGGIVEKCNQSFPSDKGTTYADTSSSTRPPVNAFNSATDLYLQFPLAAYLNGSDFINAAIGEYIAALIGALSKDIQNQMDQASLTGWQAAGQKYGWILAGAFYYQMAGENQNNRDAANISFTVTAPDPKSELVTQNYRNNYNAVGDMLNLMTTANRQSSPGFSAPMGHSDEISLALDTSAGSLLESWKSSLTSNACYGADCSADVKPVNPLISIATFGYQMMITAQLLFVVITGLVAVATAITTLNPMIFGSGLTMNPFGEAMKAIITLIGPFFVLLISSLYSIGALLGIYVPLIPYMIFTLGAIGWLIACVEAMVAGPIIALGILSPGGQHDILGRAEPALMLIFNLFLRPSLMIIGMILSMFLSIVVIKLVNSGFLAATAQIISSPGLFEQILFIAAYTSFIVTVMNKAFSLIYIIPERVLTYINGPSVSYGEEQGLAATKSAVEGAAGATAGAAKESGAAVKSQVHKQAKAEAAGKGKEGKFEPKGKGK
jgi:hypothetical protein